MSDGRTRKIEINLDYDECSRIDSSDSLEEIKTKGQFNKVHRTDLTYNEFFEKYLRANVPVIIAGIADGWECQNWVRPKENTEHNCDINFEYLRCKIGSEIEVPVANCQKEYFNSHEKLVLGFHEYLDYWIQRVQNDRENSSDEKILYLKDWHLRRQLPNYIFYATPVYFGSDWLNEYCEERGIDDYRFVYMGPKGTWTPFHVDVFSSFSWSTNIVGTKKWLFLLPNEERKLKDTLGNLPFSINESVLDQKHVHYVEIIQNAGETVFVPSGWYHQVWNLAETISLNHNWFNACNLYTIWTEMEKTFGKVVEEISDCRDMDNFDEHCQVMLSSVFGINFEVFLDLLDVVAENRVRVIQSEQGTGLVNDVEIGRNHALFDLKAILRVLEDMRGKYTHENSNKWLERVQEIYRKISTYEEKKTD